MKLKDVIPIINFRYYNEDGLTEDDKYDSSLIRLIIDKHRWIYIGADDYGCDGAIESIKEFVKPEILDMEVSSISMNEGLHCLDVMLTTYKEEYV